MATVVRIPIGGLAMVSLFPVAVFFIVCLCSIYFGHTIPMPLQVSPLAVHTRFFCECFLYNSALWYLALKLFAIHERNEHPTRLAFVLVSLGAFAIGLLQSYSVSRLWKGLLP